MNLLNFCSCSVENTEAHLASWIEAIVAKLPEEFRIFFAVYDSGLQHIQQKEHFVSGRKCEFIFYPNYETDTLATIFETAHMDVIQCFGTESEYTYRVIKYCKEKGMENGAVVFSQGFCCVCAKHYAEGVPCSVIKRFTLRDLLMWDNITLQIKKLEKRAVWERAALSLTSNLIGRTSLDHALLRKYNGQAGYYKCNDVLRECFYEGVWSYDKCSKHTIFVSQYYYPLKGFHYLLEAVSQLKEKYPDVKIVASGENPLRTPEQGRSIRDSSYELYLRKLIRKYGLQNHIEFIGLRTAEEMKENYLSANVFVLPSTIENSPNSMAEAMMLGVPTIAADVGGVSDYAVHGKEAYIYPSSAPYLLAFYIDKVFAAKEEAEVLAYAGKKRAENEYNRHNNSKTLVEAYYQIANKGEKV